MSVFDFSAFPTLTTERLILRDFSAADAPDVLVFRGDAEVQKYNDVPMQNVGEVIDFLHSLRRGYERHERLGWGITLPGEDRVIGLVGFNYWDRYHHRAEIGFDLAQAYWRQGIGSEAVRAIVGFGFERMDLNRIEGEAVIDNTGSVRLLQKLGFQLEGVRREFTLEDDGAYHGSGIFGLLRRDYYGE